MGRNRKIKAPKREMVNIVNMEWEAKRLNKVVNHKTIQSRENREKVIWCDKWYIPQKYMLKRWK